jgi:hypothetical protein
LALDGRRFAAADLDAVAEGRTVEVHLDGIGELVLWSSGAGGDSAAGRAAEAAVAAASVSQVRATYEQAMGEGGLNSDWVSGVHDRVTELLAAAATAVRLRVSTGDLDRLVDKAAVELIAEDGSATVTIYAKDLTSDPFDRLVNSEAVTVELPGERTVTLVPGW